jgi:hypothetical protein
VLEELAGELSGVETSFRAPVESSESAEKRKRKRRTHKSLQIASVSSSIQWMCLLPPGSRP